MKPIKMTLKLCHAISLDAGNEHMKRHGRSAWNQDDSDAAWLAYKLSFRLTDEFADLPKRYQKLYMKG
jgi:hypothetical protein